MTGRMLFVCCFVGGRDGPPHRQQLSDCAMRVSFGRCATQDLPWPRAVSGRAFGRIFDHGRCPAAATDGASQLVGRPGRVRITFAGVDVTVRLRSWFSLHEGVSRVRLWACARRVLQRDFSG
jgi:hypothetical protein